MSTSQWIFALLVSATNLAVGAWLITFDSAGFGLITAGLLVLAVNAFAYIRPGLVVAAERWRGKSTSTALS